MQLKATALSHATSRTELNQEERLQKKSIAISSDSTIKSRRNLKYTGNQLGTTTAITQTLLANRLASIDQQTVNKVLSYGAEYGDRWV